jgi:hypothetical protein
MPLLYVLVAVLAAVAGPGDDFATTVFFVAGAVSALALAHVLARYAAAALPWWAHHRIQLAAIRLGWVDPPEAAGDPPASMPAPAGPGSASAVTPSRGASPPRRTA